MYIAYKIFSKGGVGGLKIVFMDSVYTCPSSLVIYARSLTRGVEFYTKEAHQDTYLNSETLAKRGGGTSLLPLAA